MGILTIGWLLSRQVETHPNIQFEHLEELYFVATIYWWLSGLHLARQQSVHLQYQLVTVIATKTPVMIAIRMPVHQSYCKTSSAFMQIIELQSPWSLLLSILCFVVVGRWLVGWGFFLLLGLLVSSLHGNIVFISRLIFSSYKIKVSLLHDAVTLKC